MDTHEHEGTDTTIEKCISILNDSIEEIEDSDDKENIIQHQSMHQKLDGADDLDDLDDVLDGDLLEDTDFKRRAVSSLNNCFDDGYNRGKKAEVLVGAAMYAATREANFHIKPEHIANVVGCSESSILRTHGDMYHYMHDSYA